jgi:hypothetical protein
MIFGVWKSIGDMYRLLEDHSGRFFLVLWFFLIPSAVSFSLVYFDFYIYSSQYTYLVGFMSIMIGFLINILATMISNKKVESRLRVQLTKRIYSSSIGFVLLGIFFIILIFINPWIYVISPVSLVLLKINLFLIYALLIHLMLILLSIIKGFYSLYNQ